jgi:transcriptional regulator with GAF, ATPase, and Fis domain
VPTTISVNLTIDIAIADSPACSSPTFPFLAGSTSLFRGEYPERGWRKTRVRAWLQALLAIASTAEQTKTLASPLSELLEFGAEDTFLGVPVLDHETVRGVLVVYKREAATRDPDEEFLLTALADQAAIVLRSATRYSSDGRDSRTAEPVTITLIRNSRRARSP